MIGRVDVVGTTVAYETVGEGPDLVFLHAGIADRTMWQPQVAPAQPGDAKALQRRISRVRSRLTRWYTVLTSPIQTI